MRRLHATLLVGTAARDHANTHRRTSSRRGARGNDHRLRLHGFGRTVVDHGLTAATRHGGFVGLGVEQTTGGRGTTIDQRHTGVRLFARTQLGTTALAIHRHAVPLGPRVVGGRICASDAQQDDERREDGGGRTYRGPRHRGLPRSVAPVPYAGRCWLPMSRKRGSRASLSESMGCSMGHRIARSGSFQMIPRSPSGA
jgi:hypothetical protein